MEQIGFILGETFLYWHSILLTFAVAAAICLFLAFYLGTGGRGVGAALTVPVALLLSVVLSRLIHWYCQSAAYESFADAMTDYTTGGYALMGVFAGCFLTALLLRLLRAIDNLPRTLDCMALAGSAGIALGRLACLYSNSDRGMVVDAGLGLPWAYPVVDPVTGERAVRLATFSLQAMVTGGIFLGLTVFFLIKHIRRSHRDGETAWLFLLFHGAAQAVLDSTRYDSLFFRSNGFVSIVQVLSAVAVVLVLVVFSVRMVRAWGWKPWFPALWLAAAAFIGCAGYMEYYVQRHGDQALFAYSIMSLAMAALVILTLVIRRLAVHRERLILMVESNKE